jgi:hypothetical protein
MMKSLRLQLDLIATLWFAPGTQVLLTSRTPGIVWEFRP